MITDTPVDLVVGLLLVTLLGAVMGYAIGSIRIEKRYQNTVQKLTTDLNGIKADAKARLTALANERTELQTSLKAANTRAAASSKNEKSLELHTQFQSQRLQTLESQVSSYEEQQIRLQRDFAAFKSNKARELELAKIKPESWSRAGELPVLNKRIPHDESLMSRPFPASQARVPARGHSKLSLPLSEELDIPSLAESELPDSVDELEFEIGNISDDGDTSRG